MAEELSDFIEASGLLSYDPVAIDSIYKKNPIRLLRRLWQTLLPIGLFLLGVGLEILIGSLEKNERNPIEVGILCIITSKKNKISTEIAKLINPFLLHFPLTTNEELPTFAFPYSPVHSDRGCVYEFSLNHLLELNNPMDAFQIKVLEV